MIDRKFEFIQSVHNGSFDTSPLKFHHFPYDHQSKIIERLS